MEKHLIRMRQRGHISGNRKAQNNTRDILETDRHRKAAGTQCDGTVNDTPAYRSQLQQQPELHQQPGGKGLSLGAWVVNPD